MDTSPRLALPLIIANQAQKHLTHNEAIAQMEVLLQPVVQDMATSEPPTDPADAACYVVSIGATGLFAGKDAAIAAWIADAWTFFTPQEGWTVVRASDGVPFVFSGGAWTPLIDGALGSNVGQIGINATASTSNRLTVASDATLLTAESQSHRLTINKASAGDTASLVFQSGWSGRAEMGLAGEDGFSFKVSADGSAWAPAISIDEASGIVSMPQRPVARASLSGGLVSFSAADTRGFGALAINQGGFALGAAVSGGGSALDVPADGLYRATVTLKATTLGAFGLALNGGSAILTHTAALSGASAQTIQASAVVSLSAGHALSFVFDDAATVQCDAASSWLELVRL